MIISLIVSVVIIICDQLLKAWTVDNIDIYGQQPLLPGLLSLTHIHNDGAGFGILSGHMSLFYLVSLLMLVYLAYLVKKNRQGPWYYHLAYGLLLGGTVGNLIDRLRQGYVVDMLQLDFIDFPIFNIADVSLTAGVLLVLIIIVFTQREEVLG